MDGDVVIKLDTGGIDRLLGGALEDKAEAVVDKTAFDVQRIAQNLCRKDTGAAANSIYTVTNRSSGYGPASAAARAARPGVATNELPVPTQRLTAHVGPSVEYGIYIEYLIEPFLMPAVQAVARGFREAWAVLFK